MNIGEIIAERWRITGHLGDGCMSHAYKAEDVETGKIIVLKLIKNSLLQSICDLSAVEKQAKTFIALNHENIASYYNVYLSTDRQLFLFCDYLQGETLAALLTRVGKLPVDKSVQIFQQISAGLIYAHEKKNWHGDLRPSNIFIVNDQFSVDEAKIVDFAFMNLLERPTDSINTPYMSPEKKGQHRADPYSDLYAVGCLMYETVVGKPPFVGSTPMATAYKQKQQTTTALHDILPAHPLLSRYQTIVNKLLKADRQERYQSASDLKADLDLIANASDNEWLKKANAFKQSTYARLSAKRWHILVTFLLLTFLTIVLAQAITIAGPYYQPWTGIVDFDDSKLWLTQERQTPKPSIATVKQKYLLEQKLATLKDKKQETSTDYGQALFAYSRVLLDYGKWQQAQSALTELQKMDLKNTEIRPTDILADLALTYFMLSNMPVAEQYSKQVLSTAEQNPSWTSDKIIVLKILGDRQTSRDENKQALVTYEQLHKLAWEVHLRNPSNYAYACALLADAYRKDNQFTQAEKLYKEALDWGANFIGQKELFMAKAFYGLALTQYQLGELKQAESQLQLALPIAIAHQGNKKSNFVIALKRFNDYLLFHTNLFAWAKQHWQ